METAITFDVLKNAAATVKKDLAAAQKSFAKHPNAANWRDCLRLMFTHQQLEMVLRSSTVCDRYKLAFDLIENNEPEQWQEIISRATTGNGVRQNLQEFAVF
jgi:hypothetical protein